MLRLVKELPELQDLPVNKQIKIHHCKTGYQNDRLYIKRTEDGYLFHCFHCGGSGSITTRKSFSKEKIEKTREYLSDSRRIYKPKPTDSSCHDKGHHKEKRMGHDRDGGENDKRDRPITLPRDIQGYESFPRWAKQWLFKYGIKVEEIKKYGIVYNPSNNRVFLPAFGTRGGLAGLTSRGEIGTVPKYYTKRSNTDSWLHYGTGNSLFICEDILSAIKLARYYKAYPLLGTDINDKQFKYCLDNSDNIAIYLDNDNAIVKRKALKLYKRFSNYKPTKLITIERDPKELSDSELKGLL